MNFIFEYILSRFSPKSRIRKQLAEAYRVLKKFPKSEYSKSFLKSIFKKFFFGHNSVKYESLIGEAWINTEMNFNEKVIEIDDMIFESDFSFKSEFVDIFLSSTMHFRDFKTDKQKVAREILKILSVEGSYENENVKLKKGDVVIDAGANMGLFSIFAQRKGAKKVFAFEPQREAISILEKNIQHNKIESKVDIIPLGLSDSNIIINLNYSGDGHSSGSIIMHNDKAGSEKIECVTLDSWVKNNKIEKIDFIKADIEGAERNMLMGATETLRKFQPRLAICIYHLPDDPEVISTLIKKANPAYCIEKTSHKIFAYVP